MIVNPKTVIKRGLDLYEELAKISTEDPREGLTSGRPAGR
jgi:hypothetical protein